MKKAVPFTCLLLAAIACFAQNRKIDSLRHLLKTEKEDTNKVKTLGQLAFSLYNIKPDTTILLGEEAETLSIKLGWAKGAASSDRFIAVGYTIQANYIKALEYYQKSMKIAREIGSKSLETILLSNIATVYENQGKFPEALDNYQQAYKLEVELGNKGLQAINLGNIGIVYQDQGDFPKALDYDLQALKISEEIGDKQGQANNLGNVANVYTAEGEYVKALDYSLKALKMDLFTGNKQGEGSDYGSISSVYQALAEAAGTTQIARDTLSKKALEYDMKSVKVGEELGDKELMATTLCNIGIIYQDEGDYDNALNYFKQAAVLNEQTGDEQSQANAIGAIGSLYIYTGKFKEAEIYLTKAIALDSSIGDRNTLRKFEENISHLYDTTGRSKLALVWFKKAMVLKDTLFNIDKNKALTRKELTYSYEKKEAEQKAAQDKKDAVQKEDKRKQQIIVWAVLGGLLLALVFAGFIFRSLRITRKQKQIIEIKNIETEKQKALIEEQKAIVEEKNKDILDSITYAKRLQDAILPPLSLIKQCLPQSFVLYKPKDIVAGDFYWMENSADTILIAAADCTGHGVPGALVSVVCSNALNRTVKEFKITEPGKILDKVRELVLETFERSESNVQDGMDISLASLRPSEGGMEIQWAGAFNSLWYVHNNEMKEVVADKQPIGKTDNPKPFTTHNLNIQKGDTLYLFTDGYADQFGGEKGKKYKYKQLQEKLMAISHQPLAEQKNMLETTLSKWKGNLEQVDDVLVIGIKV